MTQSYDYPIEPTVKVSDLETRERTQHTETTISKVITVNDTNKEPRQKTCKEMEWRKFNDNHELCFGVKDVSDNLRDELVADITGAEEKGQRVVLLHRKGDAVKNMTRSQEEANTLYDVLPDNWYDLSYEQRADIMRHQPKEIDYKSWSRQQWPLNSIRYAKNIGAKVIYIQSDFNYCYYPSIFAEAMCGVLYDTIERIDNLYYHLTGPNHSLYCVGDYEVADKLLATAKRYDVIDISTLSDVEWADMSDSFLLDFYDAKLSGDSPDNTSNSYIYFPWKIIYENRHNPVIPVDIDVRRLMKITYHETMPDGSQIVTSFPQQSTATVTYLNEIPHSHAEQFIVQDTPMKSSWAIPVSWLYRNDDDKILGVRPSLNRVPVPLIQNDIRFDGTYRNPRFILNGTDITNEVLPNFLHLRLSKFLSR